MNQITPAKSSTAASSFDSRSKGLGRLRTEDGKISVAQSVVQKIASKSRPEVSGVHAMGTSSSRTFGAIKGSTSGRSGPNVAQGVGVGAGVAEAAIDVDIVVEYGVTVDKAENLDSVRKRVEADAVAHVRAALDHPALPVLLDLTIAATSPARV